MYWACVFTFAAVGFSETSANRYFHLMKGFLGIEYRETDTYMGNENTIFIAHSSSVVYREREINTLRRDQYLDCLELHPCLSCQVISCWKFSFLVHTKREEPTLSQMNPDTKFGKAHLWDAAKGCHHNLKAITRNL